MSVARVGTAWLALVLAGCGGGPSAPAAGVDPRSLCLDSACGAPVQLVDLPDLENVAVTASGRVFVAGQQGLYEIVRDAEGGFAPVTLRSGGCSGLLAQGAWVYALCPDDAGDAALMVFGADEAAPAPRAAHVLTGMTLPNGLAAGPDHALYVTDGPIAVEPKLVRLTLDPSDPRRVVAQDTWLATLPDYPNGLAIDGRALYTTLYNPTTLRGDVARIMIDTDGGPGAVERLHTRGIMDDLELVGDTLLVTDWQGNRLFQIELDGTLIQQTDAFSYAQPSALALAPRRWFDPPVVLVTERYGGRGLWAHAPATTGQR